MTPRAAETRLTHRLYPAARRIVRHKRTSREKRLSGSAISRILSVREVLHGLERNNLRQAQDAGQVWALAPGVLVAATGQV